MTNGIADEQPPTIMKSPFAIHPKARIAFSKMGSLLLLFQRTPLVQTVLPEVRVISSTGVGEIVKWTVAAVVGLGAYDSVAGATVLSQLQPVAGSAKVSATTGVRLSFVFQVTGAPSSTKSWQVIGRLPAGLTHTNSPTGNIDSITGIPTETGTFPITIKAWEESGFRGGSVTKSFNLVVTAGTTIPPVITSAPSSLTVKKGKRKLLSVVASGKTLSYQWYKGASGVTTRPIANATSASYKTPALKVTTKYWVKVQNPAGSVKSGTITVSVPKVALLP